MEEKIREALAMAEVGCTDGAHHKMWVIDQIVRILTGCEINEYGYVDQSGLNEEYREWVARFEAGEDGPHTYEWDTGIAP